LVPVSSKVRAVHPPRAPALGHGTVAFLWAIGLGLFIFLGMLSISISKGTSIVVSIVSAFVIYFAVLLFGADAPGRQRKTPREDRGR
jgi:hypothetical protein